MSDFIEDFQRIQSYHIRTVTPVVNDFDVNGDAEKMMTG